MKRLLSLLLMLSVTPALAVEISFSRTADVTGTDIYFGEIATIDAEPALRDYLAGQSVGRAPEPGGELTLQADDLWTRLQRREPQLAGATRSGAETVRVKRSGIEMGTDQVRELLEAYLHRQQSRLPHAKITLAELQPVRPFVLPRGQVRTDITPSDPDLLHSHSFNLIFHVDGQVAENLTVRASLQAWADVCAAETDLPRGSIIARSDLQAVHKDLAQLRGAYTRPEELVGQQLRRSLRRGDVIDPSMVETPPVVRRGDVVLISIRRGQLALTAQGVARRDGLLDESIPVRNQDSQRDILCRVTGPGLVKVEF